MSKIEIIVRDAKKYGFIKFVSRHLTKIREDIETSIQQKNKSNKYFVLNKKKYKYFVHPYNFTWRNERIVEIPIAWEFIKNSNGKKVLEFGNVLAHYYPITHTIIDKYEKGKGVINEDIVNFKHDSKFDLIISISTLEHVGWDEKNKDSKKILKALEVLKKHLSSEGELVLTLPIGYNPNLDEYLKQNKINFSKIYCLKRINSSNEWKQKKWDEVKNIKYGYPYAYANAIIVGIIKK